MKTRALMGSHTIGWLVLVALLALGVQPGAAQGQCKAALDSSSPPLTAPVLATFEGGSLDFCGDIVANGKTAFAVKFASGCLDEIVLSPSDVTIVQAILHFTRSRKDPNKLVTVQVYLRDSDNDPYQTDTIPLEPPLDAPSGCFANLPLNLNGEPVVSQRGKRPVGAVSVGTVRFTAP